MEVVSMGFYKQWDYIYYFSEEKPFFVWARKI